MSVREQKSSPILERGLNRVLHTSCSIQFNPLPRMSQNYMSCFRDSSYVAFQVPELAEDPDHLHSRLSFKTAEAHSSVQQLQGGEALTSSFKHGIHSVQYQHYVLCKKSRCASMQHINWSRYPKGNCYHWLLELFGNPNASQSH